MMHSLKLTEFKKKVKMIFFSKIKFEKLLLDDHYNFIHISKNQKYQKDSSIAI